MSGTATFSPDRRHRYTLTRRWASDGLTFVVVGLNPSTADETQDDPTIRRCIGFAKREGCGAFVMLNVFALRSTDPQALYTWQGVHPVGLHNDRHIREVASRDDVIVVAAWGSHGANFRARIEQVRALLPTSTLCFGLTLGGQPKHPLYLPSTAALVPFV